MHPHLVIYFCSPFGRYPTFHTLTSVGRKKLSVLLLLLSNIYNFTIKYLNKTLATRKNLSLWNLSATSDCSFCLQPESLLHIVAGCNTYLTEGRFTWRHNSALKFLAETLQTIQHAKLYILISLATFRPASLLAIVVALTFFCQQLTISCTS